jgi:hypothetical protein
VSTVPRRAARALFASFLLLLTSGPAARATDTPVACPISSLGRPHAVPVRALDVAFVGPDRLVVLDGAEAVLLGLGSGGHLTLLSRRAMPGPFDVVRAPAAIVQGSERDGAVWAMTSRSPRAVLFAVEGTALAEREQADALPFPGCARGLRFRAGTNLIEGEVEGLGGGPFLDLAAADVAVGVAGDGRFLSSAPRDGAAPARVGPTLAPLWPGWIAASTAAPPGGDDAVVVVPSTGGPPVVSCAAPGPVRAIAARTQGDTARLVVAVDDAEGRSALLVFDLPRPRP